MLECLRLRVQDLQAGFGEVWLPNALARKYGAAAVCLSGDSAGHRSAGRSDPPYHLHESAIQRAVAQTVRQSGIARHARTATISALSRSCSVMWT